MSYKQGMKGKHFIPSNENTNSIQWEAIREDVETYFINQVQI